MPPGTYRPFDLAAATEKKEAELVKGYKAGYPKEERKAPVPFEEADGVCLMREEKNDKLIS